MFILEEIMYGLEKRTMEIKECDLPVFMLCQKVALIQPHLVLGRNRIIQDGYVCVPYDIKRLERLTGNVSKAP